MPQGKTLYDILGVARDASIEEIRSAFEAKQADLRGDATPDALMVLRESHRILENPERRRKYDATLATQALEAEPPLNAPHRKLPIVLGVVAVAAIAGLLGWKLKPSAPAEPQPAAPQVALSTPLPMEGTPPTAVVSDAEPAVAQPDPTPEPVVPTGPDLPPTELYGLYWPSVVRVTAFDSDGRFVRQGSGVVTAKDTAVTHCHIVKGAYKITVRDGGTDRPGVVSLADEELDLCKLRVSQFNARVLRLGSLANVRTGQRVYALGAPWETERALAEGMVNSLHDAGKGVVIQVSTAVPPSWDGGALFSTDGNLIGILTARQEQGRDINLAVPADWIARMEPRSASIPEPETPPVMLAQLLGRWRCEDAWGKHNGEYAYGSDGTIQVTWDRKGKGGVRVPYRLEGMRVRYAARGEQMTLQIESISSGRMVQYFDSGSRLVCARMQ